MANEVLIVIDGDYRFAEPAAQDAGDFTFVTLVDALEAAGMQVTRAHRDADGDGDLVGFDFSAVDLRRFDVIWLIGWHGRNASPGSPSPSGAHQLTPSEVGAIADYMDAGGGVFATGDHDSIGADMCGHIPRVRAMRAWFGVGDGACPMPADFPRNFDRQGPGRADTTRRNPAGNYFGNPALVYFENQSDSVPQPITPTTSPAHPILRRNGADITIYPDHMHEGQTLGEGDLLAHHYTHQLPNGVDPAFVEFPIVNGLRETPKVIATGQVLAQTQVTASGGAFADPTMASPKTVNTLCVYDGRKAGVGRVVTGSTFHHYIDINLTGDSRMDQPAELAKTGPDAAKGHGFNHLGAETTRDTIHAVFVNITNWLARRTPSIRLILERSTFSHDEAPSGAGFSGAVLVTVDGLRPDQFPGGPITTLTPSAASLQAWAPTIALGGVNPTDVSIDPIGVASDSPSLPNQVQRFTFTYRVTFHTTAAFAFPQTTRDIRANATLVSPATADPLIDSAWIQLVKSASPFSLDLANGNTTPWLSSDVRVFPVVEDTSLHGVHLPAAASRADACNFIQQLATSITAAQFEALASGQQASALSPFPLTATNKRVYNFALARVRLGAQSAMADHLRVFFRIFTSQTTASLTLRRPTINDAPVQSYRQTSGANPIALPGVTAGGNEWVSFPCFAQPRAATPDTQTDTANVKDLVPAPPNEASMFFGALIDSNLPDPYLPATPVSGGANRSLPDHLMGEHQCLVAQIEYAGTPIPDASTPATSDKLAQRNIALSQVANPGLDASRLALHTFEIEATPAAITDQQLPDELLLEWLTGAPDGAETLIHIPTWDAQAVVELADRLYPRHEIQVEDAHTIRLPAGGTRYVPVPRSPLPQTGVLMAQLPLGIHKGERFDLAVRQVTTRHRNLHLPRPTTEQVTPEEARRLLAATTSRTKTGDTKGRTRTRPPGADRSVDLGDGRSLISDLRAFDIAGPGAMVVHAPDPESVAIAERESGRWRETIGGFQLGVPVSVKDDMVLHHLRLLSVMRWRAEQLPRTNRWHATLTYYVDMIARKVRALGGDPYSIPITPDGTLRDPSGGATPAHPGEGGATTPVPGDDRFLEPGQDEWLGDTEGLPDPGDAGSRILSGKVSGLIYDHFGDGEGFTLEAYSGRHVRFSSREPAILDLAERAWQQRLVCTVITITSSGRQVRRLLLRGRFDDD